MKIVRDFLWSLAMTVALFGPLMVWAADYADAATVTFSFTADDFAAPGQSQPGDERVIAVEDVAAELVGLTCTFTITTTNGESVHVNNYVSIWTNGNGTDVLGTEDGVNAVHVEDRTLELGPTITVTNHIGARAAGEKPVGTSVELTIGVTCETQDSTTTTTAQASTTTTTITPPTTPTTSVPPSSSSTIPPTTTSIPPATSTTAPTDSTTTTHHDPVTPPTEPPGSSTVPPVSTPDCEDDPTPEGCLPFTGFDLADWALAGVGMFLLGAGLVMALREEEA